MPVVRLGKNQDRRLRSGHPWVFSNEIESIEKGLEPGSEVVVQDHRGVPVGVGLYNPHSLIAVRLYARHVRPIDVNLVRDRIEAALALRRRILPVEVAYRLVYGEGDYLPGLVVDRRMDPGPSTRHAGAAGDLVSQGFPGAHPGGTPSS